MTRLLPLLLFSLCHASEGRWITVIATAYCPCSLCCEGSADGITADGTRTDSAPYGVAASPDLPLGCHVWIPVGAGYLDASRPAERSFRVDDRGGALRSEWLRSGITRLDLRYRTHWSAQQFGRKIVLVYVREQQ